MTTSVTKFLLSDTTAIKEYYQSQGYVVVKNLLSLSKIDNFINQYEKIKRNLFFIYYSQSVHLPLRPKITPEGFIEESMENATNLKFFSSFSNSILNCLVDENISTVLSILSGAPSHTMWQNMFFDKSTGTIEHQDHYYLDTNPPGHLIAAWYALEDIHEEAGCFFVLPGSHKESVIERENLSNIGQERKLDAIFSDHDLMRQKISNLIQEKNYEYKAFPLNKGDVLFWHPYTIHGSYANQNPGFSRKSFTAHFYPSHLERLYTKKSPVVKKSANPNILITENNLKGYFWNVRLYIKYFLNQLTDQGAIMDMRRESYAKDS
jgi:phytanoyl-CoA hydroxylase